MSTETSDTRTWYEQFWESHELPALNPGLAPYTDVERQPKWVARVFAQLAGQILPLSRPKDMVVPTPGKVGALLGHKCANLYMLNQTEEKFASDPTLMQRAEKLKEQLEARQDEPAVANALHATKIAEASCNELSNAGEALEKSVHAAFRKALEQPKYSEAVEFFQGFAKGLAKPGFKGGKQQNSTDATPIYAMMFMNWQEVDHLPNVAELREYLLKRQLTESQLGDLDRLKKLCQRIGYAPGKRGRPRKAEK